MKRLLTNLIVILCTLSLLALSSCKKGEDGPSAPSGTQTLIFYLAGTSLSLYYYNNISAIKEALRKGNYPNSRVILVFQHGEKKTTNIIELVAENSLCEEKTLSTIALPDRMNADALSDIFKEIMRIAPATTYSLAIGSHGTGWTPMDAEPSFSAISIAGEYSPQMERYWERTGDQMTRFLGETSNPQNAFDINVLSAAIKRAEINLNYILFDACFMANVESAYELRNSARYLIGSVCEIMGAGFPYNLVLPHMLTNNGSGFDIHGICSTFHNFYYKEYGYSGSVSAIDCTQLDALAVEMRNIKKSEAKEYNLDDIQSYEGKTNHIFFDLMDYVDKSCADEAAKASFREQLERTVVAKYTLETFYSAFGTHGTHPITSYCGLSTSCPTTVFRNYYEGTDWYRDTLAPEE